MSSTLIDSQYTTSVQTLVKQIQNSSTQKNSLFEFAALYFTLKPENNLFYPSVQKTLENLNGETLTKIHEAYMPDLCDSKLQSYEKGFWNPYRYFSINKHQNLWY